MDLITFYNTLLESLGCEIDAESKIAWTIDDISTPVAVGDRRLVLPTKNVLKEAQWEDVIAFHPLSENIVRGESVVLKKLRALVNLRLTEIVTELMVELMAIAADADYQKKLTPRQQEFLSHVKDADAKTLKDLDRLIAALDPSGAAQLLTMYLKRGGKWHGEKYSRVAVCSFPIVEEFESDDTSHIYGVRMSRKKDKKTIEGLFKYILPQCENLEHYSAGSNSLSAPYFHSLISSYIKVARQLNKVVRKYKKHLTSPDRLLIDLSWEESFNDLGQYRDRIPPLEGNIGQGGDEEAVTAPVDTGAKHATLSSGAISKALKNGSGDTSKETPPWEESPKEETPRASAPSDTGKLKWSEIMERNRQPQQQQPPQPAVPQMPTQTGWMGQPMQPGYVDHRQQAQQQTAGWGQPQPQQPMQSGWGQPVQNRYVDHRNQPQQPVQSGWGQPAFGGGSI